MAEVDHLIIYRGYSTPDLQAEIVTLRQKYQSEFSSVSGGGMSSSRDLNMVAARLTAATKAMNERQPGRPSQTVASFNIADR